MIATGLLAAALSLPTQAFPVAEVLSVYDGDTAIVALYLGLDITTTETIRVYGIDTPEVRPLATRKAGERSRDWLKARMEACGDLRVITGTKHGRPETDKYGRLLATPVCDGIDMTQEMIRLGLGVPYFGGAK
jgi:endonuclease YncB( thermonuclease family)